MRDNDEPFFSEMLEVESVSEAANYAAEKWGELPDEVIDKIDLLSGKPFLDAKVAFVIALAETL